MAISGLFWREEPFSGHTTVSLNSFLIPTTVELHCCSFGSCCTWVTDGRYCNFIVQDHGLIPSSAGMTLSVNLVWHDLKLQVNVVVEVVTVLC